MASANIRSKPDFTKVLSGRRTSADDKELGRMKNGAPRRNRTADPIITNDVLYQLSYRGMAAGSKGKGTKAQGGVFGGLGSAAPEAWKRPKAPKSAA